MSDTDNEAFVDDSPAEDIDKAKSIGWKDPSDWKGNPPKNGFVKATEYLKRADTVIPIMKSHNAQLEAKLAKSEKALEDFKADTTKTIARMSSMTKIALDRQREQIESKYSDAIDVATEVGDKATVQKLRKAEREDLKKFDEAAEESRPDPKVVEKEKETVNAALPKDVQDDIAEWLSVNPWYHKDEDMQGIANRIEGKILREQPKLTTAERLEEVRKYIVKKFPGEFEDEQQEEDKPSRGSRVEGGSRVAGGSGGSRFSKLPAEVKAQADKFIKDDGLFLEKGETAEKDLAKARERYAVKYEELN